ncbi:MAG: hypothetical protein HKP09_01345 [Enterobacterales bacterium]|nr:hypothetical protein [Enterobacterales bacterium]
MENCPCCSNKHYEDCCSRFLDQAMPAKTAEQLMRSRYSAFALGDYGDYLLSTWLGADTLGMNAAQLSERDVKWVKLAILEKSQQGDNAIVEFKAYHRDDSNNEQVLHERSSFQRINGRWYYVSGEIL